MICGRAVSLGGRLCFKCSLGVHFVFDLKPLGLLHTKLVHISRDIPGDSLVFFSCPKIPQPCFSWGNN